MLKPFLISYTPTKSCVIRCLLEIPWNFLKLSNCRGWSQSLAEGEVEGEDYSPRVLVVSLWCGSHLDTAHLWKMGRRPRACLAGLSPAWQTGSSRRKPSLGLPSIQGLTRWHWLRSPWHTQPLVWRDWKGKTGQHQLPASQTSWQQGTLDQSALFFGWVMAVCSE